MYLVQALLNGWTMLSGTLCEAVNNYIRFVGVLFQNNAVLLLYSVAVTVTPMEFAQGVSAFAVPAVLSVAPENIGIRLSSFDPPPSSATNSLVIDYDREVTLASLFYGHNMTATLVDDTVSL